MPLSRDSVELVAVILESLPLYGVSHSGQGVRERVLSGRDPVRYEAALRLDLGRCHGSGHSESTVVTRSAVREQIICRHIIGMDGDLAPLPVGAPNADGYNVGE